MKVLIIRSTAAIEQTPPYSQLSATDVTVAVVKEGAELNVRPSRWQSRPGPALVTVLLWLVFFVGPIALIIIFRGRWLSYLLLLVLVGSGLGAVWLRISEVRTRRRTPVHPDGT
jgi:hypothetical protein